MIQSLYEGMISFLARFRKTFIFLVVMLFGTPLFYLPTSIEDWEFYNNTLGDDYYLETIRPTIDKWTGGALGMFVRDVYENSGYRDPERTVLHVNAEMTHGHTLEQMNAVIAQVERYLASFEEIDQFVTNVYSGEYANLAIYFVPDHEESSFPILLKNRLITRSIDWGGVEWDIYGVGKGFSNSTGGDIPRFRVEIRGYNYTELARQADVLAENLLKHKRINEVNTNDPRYYWDKKRSQWVLWFLDDQIDNNIHLEKLVARVNSSTEAVTPAMHLFIDSKPISVFIQEEEADQFTRYDLVNRTFWTTDTTLELKGLKLGEVTRLELESLTPAIYKEDRSYLRYLTFNYMGSYHFGEKYLKEQIALMNNLMPAGYSAEMLSFNYWKSEEEEQKYWLLIVLICAIFAICSILFESLKWPLVIISMIPISFIGLFLTFALFDLYFDQGGYAAFLLLGGLVVNAGIFVLSDFRLFKHIENHNDRLLKAISHKSKPILLTIISSVCGLIPFLWGGDQEVFWFSLAAGTIGGLIFSLFAIFVFLPVIFWEK